MVQSPSMAATDKYVDAQASLSYSVSKPGKTLGLGIREFELIPCVDQSEPWLYVKLGGTVRYLEIMQSKAGIKCSDPGLSKKLRNITINGNSAQVHVYCDPAKPATFKKCSTADISRLGGYILFTNKGTKNRTPTEIQVQGIGGITYSQLLDVAKSLTPVKASNAASPTPTTSD